MTKERTSILFLSGEDDVPRTTSTIDSSLFVLVTNTNLMAPKRKRPFNGFERPISKKSSFVECPACQMQVISCLMNDHLDWNCSALASRAQVNCSIDTETTSKTQTVPLTIVPSDLGVPRQDFQLRLCVDPSMDPISMRAAEVGGGAILKSVQIEEKPLTSIQTKDEESLREEAYKKDQVRECNGLPSPENAGAATTNFHTCKIDASTNMDKPWKESSESERCSSGSEAGTASTIKSSNRQWKFSTVWPVLKAPKGHAIVEDFISSEEEDHLVCSLDMDLRNPWKVSTFNGLHMSKAYGVVTDLKRRMVQPAIFEMPKFLQPIIERMRGSVPLLKEFWPNETNAIDYCKTEGHWLKPHVDDRQLSGTMLVNLSLSGGCKMTYERERGSREFYKVLLKRRSIQILTGESRYNFTHSIQNQDLLDPRRISLTFRQSVWPSI